MTVKDFIHLLQKVPQCATVEFVNKPGFDGLRVRNCHHIYKINGCDWDVKNADKCDCCCKCHCHH